jgi:hypothetical protein
MKTQESRTVMLVAVLLVCGSGACRPVSRPPLTSTGFQSKVSAPTAGKPAACAVGSAELADLNRQIMRLSKEIVSVKAELHALTTSAAYRPAKECGGKCAQDTSGASAAAQKLIGAAEQNCQSLLQSLGELEQLRSDLVEGCPTHVNLPTPPVNRTCRE